MSMSSGSVNVVDVFSEALAAAGLVLERFEIGETPLRTYIIRQEDDHSTEKDGIL